MDKIDLKFFVYPPSEVRNKPGNPMRLVGNSDSLGGLKSASDAEF